MSAYAGPGSFPYWMTIANSGGVSGAAAQSESIPVTVGLNYQFQVVLKPSPPAIQSESR